MHTPSLISTYIIQTPHYTYRHIGKGNRETTQEKKEGRRCLGEMVQGVECLPQKHEDLSSHVQIYSQAWQQANLGSLLEKGDSRQPSCKYKLQVQ